MLRVLFTFPAWSSSLIQCWAVCCNSAGIPRDNFSIDFSSNRPQRLHPFLNLSDLLTAGQKFNCYLNSQVHFWSRQPLPFKLKTQTDVFLAMSGHHLSELLMAEANFFLSSHKLYLLHLFQSLWRIVICHVISGHNLASAIVTSHKSLHISWACRFLQSHICGRWPPFFSTQLKYVCPSSSQLILWLLPCP